MCITHRMLPTSDTNRYIQVSAGSAHVRILKKTVDEMDVPIVERMTLKKLGKMTARQVKLWKMKAIEAINNVPEESRQMTVDTYFTQPSPATSYHRRHTHEAPSPVKKAAAGSSADPPTPDSTPGKWAGKKRPMMASRKREQARDKKAVAKLSLAEYHA